MVCEKYRKTPSICNTDDAIKYSEQYWDPINHLIDGNIPDCYMEKYENITNILYTSKQYFIKNPFCYLSLSVCSRYFK